MAWVRKYLPGDAGTIETLRDEAGAQLAAGEAEVRSWLAAGEQISRRIGEEIG